MQLLDAASGQILAMKIFVIQALSTYSETVSVVTPNKLGPWHLEVVLIVAGDTLNWAVTTNIGT